jgi:prolipoprotein diacylglyceryltransferase
MKLVFLIPSFLIFLYCLYKFFKDDYVFIRRNITLEHVFDMAFIVVFISVLFSRLFYFVFHPSVEDNFFLSYFSFQKGGYSLSGGVISGLLMLSIIGKYRKVSFGRLFDFFILSFLISLPIGFLSQLFFLKKNEIVLSLINVVFYSILSGYFAKFLYPRILNRSLKEGNISILFLIFFSFLSLLMSLLTGTPAKGFLSYITLQNILFCLMLLFSFILLFKEGSNGSPGKRNAIKK